jgi:hypothetical protein
MAGVEPCFIEGICMDGKQPEETFSRGPGIPGQVTGRVEGTEYGYDPYRTECLHAGSGLLISFTKSDDKVRKDMISPEQHH